MGRHKSKIDELIRGGKEHENLEFKEAKNSFSDSKLFKYCVAIANEGGGILVLGVDESAPRKIVGSAAYPNTAKIQQQILERLNFRVDVTGVEHPNGRVVLFEIPSRPKGTAHSFEGAFWMRSGDSLVPMTSDRLRSIFAEGQPDWSAELALSEITEDTVIAFLDTQAYFDLMEAPYPSERDAVLSRLTSEGLIRKRGERYDITNLGAILFAKRLQKFDGISRKRPRVVIYEGTGKQKTKKEVPGSLGYAAGFERLAAFINDQLPGNEVVESTIRRQVKMYPDIAIRELIANALIHQDFTETGTSVMIEIYDDRIEISNPGKPFISPDRFIDEYQSRNEQLASFMRRIGICEERGSGIDKVIASAEAFQLPPPDFRATDRRTTVVLYAHKPFDKMERKERVRACYQHCCLKYVMNEDMTNGSLRERFKLATKQSETASRIIRETVKEGLIKPLDKNNPSKRMAKYVPNWA